MKKILAFVLVVAMLFAVAVMPASALEPPLTLEEELSRAFRDYCLANVGDIPSDVHERITDIYDNDSGVVYFTACWLEPANMGTYEVIGEYCVHSNVYQYPYELGVYVYKEDVVYSLREAFDEGIINNVYFAGNLDFITIHEAGEDVNLTHKCMDSFARYADTDFDKDTYIKCHVYGEVGGTAVFRAHVTYKDAMYPCVCSQQRIGGYIFDYGYIIGPEDNPTGLYILKDGEVIPALKAYLEGKIYIEDLVSVVPAGKDPYNVEAIVAEKLGFPSKDSTLDEGQLFPYLYKERYAHYSTHSSTSADDPEYILVFAAKEPGPPIEPADRIGDYAVCSNAAYGAHHGYYIYIPATGALYDLRSAVEDTVDIEGIAQAFLNMGSDGGIIGDADKDGKITIKDATYIQKILAGVEVQNPYAYYHSVVDLIRDFNRDDTVNVKDATAIQKFLAGLPY